MVTAVPGFFISSKMPLVVSSCPHKERCLGGEESACLYGYEGDLCLSCSRGHRCVCVVCVLCVLCVCVCVCVCVL
jgi:hypothetical protein